MFQSTRNAHKITCFCRRRLEDLRTSVTEAENFWSRMHIFQSCLKLFNLLLLEKFAVSFIFSLNCKAPVCTVLLNSGHLSIYMVLQLFDEYVAASAPLEQASHISHMSEMELTLQ